MPALPQACLYGSSNPRIPTAGQSLGSYRVLASTSLGCPPCLPPPSRASSSAMATESTRPWQPKEPLRGVLGWGWDECSRRKQANLLFPWLLPSGSAVGWGGWGGEAHGECAPRAKWAGGKQTSNPKPGRPAHGLPPPAHSPQTRQELLATKKPRH